VVSSREKTDVAVLEITIAPGGSTGWHYHTGQLIAVVKSGTLTRTLHDCSTEVSTAGSSLVEPAGQEHVHLGRNLGIEPVVLLVTYVLPAGHPLSHDAPAPTCA
jgi:quercetin dioxygenase-like cupin family protein